MLIESNNLFHKQLRVKVNQKILRGQPLTFGDEYTVPVHAPTSGWIEDISFSANTIINKEKKNIKIIIIPDYLDKWIRLKPIKHYKMCTSEKLIKKIYQSGVVGLGGGQFSSAKKLMLSMNKANTLIVNAVESEPYITSDNCLINNYASDILMGCKIVSSISKIKIILIAIQEDNIESISRMVYLTKNNSLFKICIIKKKYPGGSSKVLVKMLIGKEIPYNKHSIDIGCLVFNVATIYAIKRAVINGEPLTERIVTILSDEKSLSGNFWMRIGTPIEHLVKHKIHEKNVNITGHLGGPFMGKKIYNLNDCISKKTNFIWLQFKKDTYKKIVHYNCIRCSYCSNVCPVNLLPQQIYLYAKNKNHEKTREYNVLDCIECKACEKVCPSHISLVKFFKKEKKILKDINIENRLKKLSFLRFKEREKRLLKQKEIINNICNLEEKNKRKQKVYEAIERMKAKT